MNLPRIDKANGNKAQAPVSAMYEPPEGLAGVKAPEAAPEETASIRAARRREERKKDRERLPRAQRAYYIIFSVLGVLALTWVTSQLLNILAIPVAIIIWTVVIIFILRSPVAWFEKHGINRALGTTLAFVLMFAILGLIAFVMVSPTFGFADQMKNLIESVPELAGNLQAWVNNFYADHADLLNNENAKKYMNEALAGLSTVMQTVAKDSAASIMGIGSGVANGFMAFGFGLVVAFWLLMELPALGKEVNRLISPNYKEDFEMLHATTTRVMGGFITATVVQCAIIGVGCTVLFVADGTPNALAIGVITGILNVIPVVGPWFGGMLAAIAGIVVSPMTALISLVGTIVIQQLVYTFVSPRIMANSVDIHPALTLIVLMIGSALGTAMSGLGGALLGALISIPVTAIIKAEFAYYFEKNTGRHLIAEDGVFFKGSAKEEDEVDPLHDALSPHPDATAAMSSGLFGTKAFAKAGSTGAIGAHIKKDADENDADKRE